MAHSHRPGSSHQQNKAFKSRSHTKGELKTKLKGKVQRQAVKHRKSGAMTKNDRRNAAKLHREHAKHQRLLERRLFTGRHRASKIIAVFSLCPDIQLQEIVSSIVSAAHRREQERQLVVVTEGKNEKMETEVLSSGRHISVEWDGQTFVFVVVDRHRQDLVHDRLSSFSYFTDVLRACQVADFVLPLASAEEEVDELGIRLLDAISAQGSSTMVVGLQHLEKEKLKRQPIVKKSVFSFIQDRFPETEKIFSLPSETGILLPFLSRSQPKGINWRDTYAYMLLEQLERQGEMLVAEGVLRGSAMNIKRLVHCPTVGDLEVVQAELLTGEQKIIKRAVDGQEDMPLVHELELDPMAGEQTWPTEEELAEAEERVRLLKESENNSKKRRLVPKGTSSYQAAWIEEDQDEELDDDDTDEDFDQDVNDFEEDDEMQTDPEIALSVNSGLSDLDIERVNGGSLAEEDEDEDEGQDDWNAYRLERQQKEQSNRSRKDELVQEAMFPDEKDTPMDTPARIRFQKYRGLKKFRGGEWDPYENLPQDYGRIFQFEDFSLTKRRTMAALQKEKWAEVKATKDGEKEKEEMLGDGMQVEGSNLERADLVPMGRRVRLTLRITECADLTQLERLLSANGQSWYRPITLFGMLPHEEKMSVLHFTCKRPLVRQTDDEVKEKEEEEEEKAVAIEEPIVKSKDVLWIQCGYRCFLNRPLFSHHAAGPLHKMVKFLNRGQPLVGSIFAPISMTSAPVLTFIAPEAGRVGGDAKDQSEVDRMTEVEDVRSILPQLISHGTVLSVDPNRLVIKRVVLTGTPTKLHKASRHSLNTAVVKYMFFNAEDIAYFKPVALRTKEGRNGHILDSIGTHGAMKCSFERSIQQSDTVCLSLYKRVYPKWPRDGYRGLFSAKDSASTMVGK